MVDISVEIAGIKLRNPVLTAAGPPSVSYTHLTLPTKRIV